MGLRLAPPQSLSQPAARRPLGRAVGAVSATRPMTVGLDVSTLDAPRCGIGRYTYELLGALWNDGSEPTVVPIGNRRLAAGMLPSAPDGTSVVHGPRFPSRAAWTFGLLPLWLRGAGLDVFHGTSFYAPLASGVPTIVTFHDMAVFACPESHPRSRVLRARAMLRHVAAAASAIITPSDSARQETIRWLGVPPERIHVVPGAPARHFRRVGERRAIEVAERYGLEPGFFLALGTVEPRKNLVAAIEAVARLRAAGQATRLVVAGRLGWKYEPILERVDRLGLADVVRFLGFVPDDDLPALMSAAAALVYPSLYEGFGLPIVEAMACGLPVITSAAGATAEVAGRAALLVDPRDPDAIAEAMRTVVEPAVRARLEAAGALRAAEFSWQRSARETLAVYQSVSRQRRARS